MQNYIVTLRISTEGDIDADRIQEELYNACEEVPFGLDVITVVRAGAEYDRVTREEK